MINFCWNTLLSFAVSVWHVFIFCVSVWWCVFLSVHYYYYSDPDQAATLSFNISPETRVSTQPEQGTHSAPMFTYTLTHGDKYGYFPLSQWCSDERVKWVSLRHIRCEVEVILWSSATWVQVFKWNSTGANLFGISPPCRLGFTNFWCTPVMTSRLSDLCLAYPPVDLRSCCCLGTNIGSTPSK